MLISYSILKCAVPVEFSIVYVSSAVKDEHSYMICSGPHIEATMLKRNNQDFA